jgi:hypothetical protein
MKKRKKNGSAMVDDGEASTEPKAPPQKYSAPEGYETRTSDIAGFWDPDLGPIHFIPQYAKAFDSHLEKAKPTIIIVGHAVGPNRIVTAEDEDIECKSGDVIGVWYKPGMAQLKDLCGAKVFMQYTGDKDVGKVNPMKEFQIDIPRGTRGGVLYLQDDYRKTSRAVTIPFDVKPSLRPRAVDDDENFGGRTKDIPY